MPNQDIVDEVPAPLEIVDLGKAPENPIAGSASSNALTPTPESAATALPPTPEAIAEPHSEAASSPGTIAPEPGPAVAGTTIAEAPAPTPAPAAAPLTAPDPNRPLQRFINAASPRKYRRNFNSPAPVDFLTSFQVQQVGRQLLLVDADGSTFSGEIEPPNNGASSLRFRVIGTSQALNRQVSIVGNLSPAGAAATGNTSPDNLRVANESRLPLDKLRIDARATIGEESRPITATPASGQ